jgi:hypothetical protein
VAAGIEAGGAHSDHLDGIGTLHRGDGVAGVDRALERVLRLTTLVASLIWATSSSAATRGATFLPLAVAGKRMWL